MAEGLTVVKKRKVRGFFCISVVSRNSNVDCGLVCLEFLGVFLHMCHTCTGLPIVGRIRAGRAVVGRRWDSFFLFLKKLEIALYFNF